MLISYEHSSIFQQLTALNIETSVAACELLQSTGTADRAGWLARLTEYCSALRLDVQLNLSSFGDEFQEG